MREVALRAGGNAVLGVRYAIAALPDHSLQVLCCGTAVSVELTDRPAG